jgi:hypothetical protein
VSKRGRRETRQVRKAENNAKEREVTTHSVQHSINPLDSVIERSLLLDILNNDEAPLGVQPVLLEEIGEVLSLLSRTDGTADGEAALQELLSDVCAPEGT